MNITSINKKIVITKIDNRHKKEKSFYISLLILIALFQLLSGCSTIPNPYDISHDTVPIMAQSEISNEELMDVSIRLFETGSLPEEEDKKRGLSEEIRNSESRYIPIHLKYTMERTGYWGNVRVVPDDNIGTDLLIKGEIIKSNGESLALNIKVFDASKNKWFEKKYSQTVYSEERELTEIQKKDTFQGLYNKISNDIIEYRQKLTSEEIARIKQISEMRFAQLMAPETFDNYLQLKSNQYELSRLPANDDPMIKRVKSIKSRDDLLVDTINNYYNIYYSNMWESYDNWRKFRSEELQTIREIERKAMAQKAIGVAAIVGAIALGASSNYEVRDRTGTLRTIMIAGGGYALYSGFETSKESEINKEVIEELGASFSNEVEPMLIDVNGKTMKLTGSAEQQYDKWRALLKKIYKEETGF